VGLRLAAVETVEYLDGQIDSNDSHRPTEVIIFDHVQSAVHHRECAPAGIGVTSYGALGHVPPLELGHVKKIGSFYDNNKH